LRFDPDDDARLTVILERICDDTKYRADIIAAQAQVWPQFTAGAVATRIWSAIETLLTPPRVFLPRRARVAMLTPLPPARSGVANYSAALAARLEQHVELTLYSSTIGGNAEIVSGVPHLSPRFDRVISVMGNSTDHHAIYDLAVRYGSACICHDARLLGLAATRFGLTRAAQMASRELGRAVNETQLQEWAHNEQLREADFLGELAASSRPLIFHTRQSVQEVKTRFGQDAVFLPFAVYLPAIHAPINAPNNAAARRRAREKLGVPLDEKIICSFGGIDPVKGIEPALRAMALLRRDGVACRLYWVGEGEWWRPRLEALAAKLGVGGLVHFSRDYVSAETYQDFLLAADAGLQLRVGRPGNISGALQDCIAAGLPTVASEDLAENLQAPAFISRVSDRLDPAEIAAALTKTLGAQPPGAFEDARAAYCEAHSMERYAASLCEILDISA
jgi:glycosyltransferase involved in cell wall biosynthesis